MTAATINAHSFTTPVGQLSVLVTGLDQPTDESEAAPAVVAAGFCTPDDLWERLPTGDDDQLAIVDHLGPLHEPIERYISGDATAIDEVRVDQAGTELQREVWDGLRAIPAGETRTYSELAATTSKPNAVRAVGSACGRNLIAPFVPCHRALRSDGSLGGYYYGLDVKRWLLDLEAESAQLSLDVG
jgi:methylated-DNA-[protein]-cysteine S-methyltransferase